MSTMDRDKSYQKKLEPQGWRLLAILAEKVFGEVKRASGSVWKDGGNWGFDNLEDFLTDVNPVHSSLYIYFKPDAQITLVHHDRFSWRVDKASKQQILGFEREAEEIIKVHGKEITAASEKPFSIFIGHGRSDEWRELKDHLTDKHRMRVEAYETGARSGHTIRDVLEELMGKASLAVLVHTPEDEQANGSFNSRPNVIHETGLFQGRLGFSKAIVLLKEGTTEFSNIAGIQQVRYRSIRESFGDVLAWIKREQNAEEAH